MDIQITHPATGEPIRSRSVAPRGVDEAAARAWGEQQVQLILRSLFKGSVAKVEEDYEDEKPKKKSGETSRHSTPARHDGARRACT